MAISRILRSFIFYTFFEIRLDISVDFLDEKKFEEVEKKSAGEDGKKNCSTSLLSRNIIFFVLYDTLTYQHNRL